MSQDRSQDVTATLCRVPEQEPEGRQWCVASQDKGERHKGMVMTSHIQNEEPEVMATLCHIPEQEQEGMVTICPIPEQQVWGETVWSVQTQGLGLQLTRNAAHKNISKTWPWLLAPSIGRTRIEVRLTWYGGTDGLGMTDASLGILSRLGREGGRAGWQEV
jgi:hypothetical protein